MKPAASSTNLDNSMETRGHDSTVDSPLGSRRHRQSDHTRFWLIALAISGWYFALRLPGITALPIFCDETSYLRWAQLIRRSPLQNAFISHVDSKPPLHLWLVALGGGLSSDPLLAGRLVSVFAGFVTLLAVGGFCIELGQWRKNQPGCRDSSRMFVLLAVLLTLFSPYIAFNQRMVSTDGVFLLASVSAAWISLYARRLLDTELGFARGLFFVSLPLGLIMGAAMLTRQGVSYTLWLLPLVAMLTGKSSRDGSRRWGVAASWLTAAGVLACALWVPAVLHGVSHDLVANWATVKERVVYHSNFTSPLSLPERLKQIRDNFMMVCIPSAHGRLAVKDIYQGLTDQAETGWYWFYLTPPVFLLSLASFVYLAIRKQWRVLVFLGCYFAVTTAPFLLVGTRLYSRYLLHGAIPLLVALAWMIADLFTGWMARNSRSRMVCSVAMVGALFIPSARQILLQDFQPSRQTLTTDDRGQYLNGWASGYASIRAVQYVKDLARQKPVVVITTHAWGPPHDVLWLYLDGYPNVSVYYVDWFGREAVLKETGNGKYLLRRNKWLPQPPLPEPIAIDPAAIVLLALFPNEAGDSNDRVIQKYDRIIGEPVCFSNNEFVGLPGTGNGAGLYQLDHPAR